MVDPTGIEPATSALQVLFAPKDHASPSYQKLAECTGIEPVYSVRQTDVITTIRTLHKLGSP
jgi:hypothetical protein